MLARGSAQQVPEGMTHSAVCKPQSALHRRLVGDSGCKAVSPIGTAEALPLGISRHGQPACRLPGSFDFRRWHAEMCQSCCARRWHGTGRPACALQMPLRPQSLRKRTSRSVWCRLGCVHWLCLSQAASGMPFYSMTTSCSIKSTIPAQIQVGAFGLLKWKTCCDGHRDYWQSITVQW